MMGRDTAQRLREIFRTVLELPVNVDVHDMARENAANWDSLAHVSLVVGIESEFGITLDTLESLGLTSYAAAEALLTRKGL